MSLFSSPSIQFLVLAILPYLFQLLGAICPSSWSIERVLLFFGYLSVEEFINEWRLGLFCAVTAILSFISYFCFDYCYDNSGDFCSQEMVRGLSGVVNFFRTCLDGIILFFSFLASLFLNKSTLRIPQKIWNVSMIGLFQYFVKNITTLKMFIVNDVGLPLFCTLMSAIIASLYFLNQKSAKEKAVQRLADSNTIDNKNGDNEETPLYVAARDGDDETVKYLIQYGAQVTIPDMNDFTPLSKAAMNGNVRCLELLLAAGATLNKADFIDKADNRGYTPLSWAAYKGHKECVSLLVKAGANKLQANQSGLTPLMRAENFGMKECAELLR